jgi:hypothetical protein
MTRASGDRQAAASSMSTRTVSPIGASATGTTSDDVPTDAEMMYGCISRGDLSGLQTMLGFRGESRPSSAAGRSPKSSTKKQQQAQQIDEAHVESLLTAPLHPPDGIMSGENAVFFCAYLNQRGLLKHLLAEYSCVQQRLIEPVLLKMMEFQRFPIVLFIGKNYRPALTDPHGAAAETLLHMVCHRRKPPVAFIEELVQTVKTSSAVPLGTFLNAKNDKGDTALHLVAKESKGKEGEAVAKYLLLHGAHDDLLNAAGQDVRAVAQNPYVRDLLTYFKAPRPRPIPPIDPQSKEEIDKCKSSELFPPLKPVEIPPTDPSLLLSASPIDALKQMKEAAQMKKVKKLQQDEVESLTNRLAVQSIQQRDRWMQTQMSQIEEKSKTRSKIISAEEAEAATQRLYNDDLSHRTGKLEQLKEKYLKPLPAPPEIEPEALEASAIRLGGKQAVSHRETVHQQLMAKYSPPREGRKLTPSQVQASAARLHDESTSHAKESHSALFLEYCPPPPKKTISPTQLSAMADRLSKRK